MDSHQRLINDLVVCTDRAARLGLYGTMHALTAVTQTVGWEVARIMTTKTKTKIREHRLHRVREDEACPFALCAVLHAHAHPVCATCGAVRFGNAACSDCRLARGEMVNPIVVRGAVLDGASS